MLATKKPPGDWRSAAILRSASLVKPSMVSAYKAILRVVLLNLCVRDDRADVGAGGDSRDDPDGDARGAQRLELGIARPGADQSHASASHRRQAFANRMQRA